MSTIRLQQSSPPCSRRVWICCGNSVMPRLVNADFGTEVKEKGEVTISPALQVAKNGGETVSLAASHVLNLPFAMRSPSLHPR